MKAICSSRFLADDSSVYVNGDTHVYAHRDTHTASNVKALDLRQRYQISYLIRNLDAPTLQTSCWFLLKPDFVAKIKCYFSPSFVETICWCLDRIVSSQVPQPTCFSQSQAETLSKTGRINTRLTWNHLENSPLAKFCCTSSVSARSFLKSLSI